MSERRKPSGYGTGRYEEKRSRFIGEVWPVADEAEAKVCVAEAKKKTPDARHHCWAYVLPAGECHWSDDGEPGGTAGAPISDVLRNVNVFGAVCVVTRYFGGTLLGSGGLVRAYSNAAAKALDDAGTEPDPEKLRLQCTCRWECLDRVHRLIQKYGETTAADYDSDPERANLEIKLNAADEETFLASFMDVTLGQEKIFEKNKGK